MGYTAAEAHVQADLLGDTFTDDMVERIATQLGNPDRCPHGWPVDVEFEQAENKELAPLADLEPGAQGRDRPPRRARRRPPALVLRRGTRSRARGRGAKRAAGGRPAHGRRERRRARHRRAGRSRTLRPSCLAATSAPPDPLRRGGHERRVCSSGSGEDSHALVTSRHTSVRLADGRLDAGWRVADSPPKGGAWPASPRTTRRPLAAEACGYSKLIEICVKPSERSSDVSIVRVFSSARTRSSSFAARPRRSSLAGAVELFLAGLARRRRGSRSG